MNAPLMLTLKQHPYYKKPYPVNAEEWQLSQLLTVFPLSWIWTRSWSLTMVCWYVTFLSLCICAYVFARSHILMVTNWRLLFQSWKLFIVNASLIVSSILLFSWLTVLFDKCLVKLWTLVILKPIYTAVTWTHNSMRNTPVPSFNVGRESTIQCATPVHLISE